MQPTLHARKMRVTTVPMTWAQPRISLRMVKRRFAAPLPFHLDPPLFDAPPHPRQPATDPVRARLLVLPPRIVPQPAPPQGRPRLRIPPPLTFDDLAPPVDAVEMSPGLGPGAINEEASVDM